MNEAGQLRSVIGILVYWLLGRASMQPLLFAEEDADHVDGDVDDDDDRNPVDRIAPVGVFDEFEKMHGIIVT